MGLLSRIVKALPVPVPSVPSNNWMNNGGWWPIVREPFTGAWQRNMEIRCENILTYSAVYACVTLIASDIAKIRLRLVQQDSDGIWTETKSPAFSPVLAKPNRYQNRIKFIQNWMTSKLLHGNTYVLLQRDNRSVVVAMYILDPLRVKPYVTEDGQVYYGLSRDNLTGQAENDILIPASEIIHDVMVPLYHPLCGVSPLTACGMAAAQGLAIQSNSTRFFSSGSHPGGVLTAPGLISQETAQRIKDHWDRNYTGENLGKVAVLGDGLKFERMSVNASDAQLIDQLKWTAEQVCTAFHVPPYMIGIGAMPTYTNIEALTQAYYGQCLQIHIESIELALDEGLGIFGPISEGKIYGTEFDLDDLLRMDTPTKVKSYTDAIRGGLMKPDEGRAKFDLKPVTGGDEVYLQQQNYSLSALAKRDAKDDPFGTQPPAAPEPAPPPEDDDEEEPEPDDEARTFDASKLADQLFARSRRFLNAP